MLAPHIESNDTAARSLGVASRNMFPAWVSELQEATGIKIMLLRNGVVELAPDERSAQHLRGLASAQSTWLDPDILHVLEPDLAEAAGALLHKDDGAVDNVALIEALRQRLLREHMVRLVEGEVVRIVPHGLHPAVVTRTARFEVDRIVMAAGAWVNEIRGLPAPLRVEPLRGQMLALTGCPIEHAVYAPDVYLVPRNGTTLVGATMERVGFETGTTEAALRGLRAAARVVVPALVDSSVSRSWSGLRPVTPDFLPIIGADPGNPALIYACGHSRNGILLAPLTGECVAALALGEEPEADLAPFSPQRFAPGQGSAGNE
jgi:glycine oxidase